MIAGISKNFATIGMSLLAGPLGALPDWGFYTYRADIVRVIDGDAVVADNELLFNIVGETNEGDRQLILDGPCLDDHSIGQRIREEINTNTVAEGLSISVARVAIEAALNEAGLTDNSTQISEYYISLDICGGWVSIKFFSARGKQPNRSSFRTDSFCIGILVSHAWCGDRPLFQFTILLPL